MTTQVQEAVHVGPVCHASGITGLGSLKSGIVMVGVMPGLDEVRRSRKPMTGNSGQFANAMLKYVDLDRADVYATNVICFNAKNPTLAEAQGCLQRLKDELKQIKPKVILALGNVPIEFFTRMTPSRVRGCLVWSDEFDCWIIPTFQPAAVFQQPDYVADLVRDFRKIELALAHPEGRSWGDVTYTVIDSVGAAQARLKGWVQANPRFLACDIETKHDGTSYTDEIRCVGISDGVETIVIPEHVFDAMSPTDWPKDLNWTFHNAMFDTSKLKLAGVDLPIVEDTLLMSYSLDERGGGQTENATELKVGIHDLKRNSREYCGAGFYEKSPKDCNDEELYRYNAHDAAYTARLAKYFYNRQLEDGEVRRAYEELMLPTAYTFREQKAYGIYANPQKINNLAVKWCEKWLDEEDYLTQEAVRLGYEAPSKINLNSPIQLKKFFNDVLKLGVPDTQADTIKQYRHVPWVVKFQEWKRLDKMLSVYVIGVQECVDSNGYVHPDASIHGTRTGRVSYHRPPVQTIPTGHQYYDPDDPTSDNEGSDTEEYSQLRDLFGASPGKVFIEADFAQAELWIAALYSDDKNMLEDLSEDFHTRAAERMWSMKQEDYDPRSWAHIRRESKYVTFGKLYGRTAKSLWTGIPGIPGDLSKYSLKEVETFVRNWETRYYKYIEQCKTWTHEAARDGEQSFLSGRKRRYYAPTLFAHHLANMAANSPIQSLSHDHLLLAMNELYSMFEHHQSPARPLWDGHDAIYFEVDPPDLVESVPIIKSIMNKPRYFDRGLVADIKIGTTWGDVKEMKTLEVIEAYAQKMIAAA